MTRLGQMLYMDGKAEGDRERLRSQVQKKLGKGKSLEIIAEEVEEDVGTVQVLIKEITEGVNYGGV